MESIPKAAYVSVAFTINITADGGIRSWHLTHCIRACYRCDLHLRHIMSSSDFHCIIKSDIMTSLTPHLMLLMLLLITFPKWKLRLPGHQISWMIEWLSDWVHNFSPCASSAMEAAKETKFGTKVAWGWGWCPNIEYAHSAHIAQRKHAIPHLTMKHTTCAT